MSGVGAEGCHGPVVEGLFGAPGRRGVLRSGLLPYLGGHFDRLGTALRAGSAQDKLAIAVLRALRPRSGQAPQHGGGRWPVAGGCPILPFAEVVASYASAPPMYSLKAAYGFLVTMPTLPRIRQDNQGTQERSLMKHTRYLMAASSRTFLLGLDRSSMVFDKRSTPMALEQMHTFSFGSDEVEHLLNGTMPSPVPGYWEYRGNNLIEKVDNRAQYGGEGIIVEFRAGQFEVPGFEYKYYDATPLMFGFTPGVAYVSNVYRLTKVEPLTITAVSVENLLP